MVCSFSLSDLFEDIFISKVFGSNQVFIFVLYININHDIGKVLTM